MRPTGPPADAPDQSELSVTHEIAGSWFLEVGDDEALTVAGRGLVIGRDPSCDLVLTDRTASQRQAVVLPMGPRLEVLALGRNPTLVDGERVQTRAWLTPGQVLEVPGLRLRVGRIGGVSGTRRRWLVRAPEGSYGLRQLPMSLGGGTTDSVQLFGWPPGALHFRLQDGLLVFETGVALQHGSREVPAGAVEVASPGDAFTVAVCTVHLHRERVSQSGGTELVEASGRPLAARFEFMARGGALTVDYGAGAPIRVELPELRARLVAALLSPPRGYTPGEYLPDDILIPAIWSGNAARTRTDLNVLLHHTRKALVRAGLNPAQVLSRAKTGGSTCFLLAPDAQVEVV